MPVLVGTFAHKTRCGFLASAVVERVSKLATVPTKAIAQLTLVCSEGRPWFVVTNCELFDDLPRASFRHAAGSFDGAFEVSTEVAV